MSAGTLVITAVPSEAVVTRTARTRLGDTVDAACADEVERTARERDAGLLLVMPPIPIWNWVGDVGEVTTMPDVRDDVVGVVVASTPA